MVIIVGAGPTGLWMAAELRHAGVQDVRLVDRRASRVGESRAGGLHARSLEILESRGLAERFVAAGRRVPNAHFAGLWLDLSRLDTKYPFVLGLVQSRIEALLEEHLLEAHGTRVEWNTEITDLATLAGADWVIGCDGGRSSIRRALGIPFEGTDPSVHSMLADVHLTDPPSRPVFQERTPLGDYTVLPLEPGWYRLMVNQYSIAAPAERTLTLDEFRTVFTAMAGTDFGMHNPLWTSRYHDAARLARHYRQDNVFLAGDAAHVHWPSGGQGLNTGLQDAHNLAWKLALVLQGRASASLLDTYEAERRPVAERVLANTRAQAALCRPGPQTDALRATLADLLTIPSANDRLAAMIAGLDQVEPSRSAFSLA